MDEKTKAQIQQEAADLVAKLQPRSGKFRTISPEMDPLRLGSGWSIEDLDKPQVIIESTFGDSHPGSAGLFELVEEVRAGVAEAGGHGARYFCTDICDGEVVKVSLPLAPGSRDDVVFAGLNGVSFYFMRGTVCEMPATVLEILKNCGEM